MVVGALSTGSVRCNALQRVIECVLHRMLTLTLRGLRADRLVVRTAHLTVPPPVEHELTEMGQSLIDPLKALLAWAERTNQPFPMAQAAASLEIQPRTDMIVRSGQPIQHADTVAGSVIFRGTARV